MRVRYTGSKPIWIPDAGVEVDPGDEFDASDEVAASLCEQVDKFTAVKAAAAEPGEPADKE